MNTSLMEHSLVLEQITPAELAPEVVAVLGAAAKDGSILRFKNAVLARAEVNRNGDDLTAPEFLQGVAETLPLQPIDVEHNMRELCGVFTAARLDDGALYTDGLIYMARYPEIAAGIQQTPPTHFLSIEATAPQVACSICGKQFVAGSPLCAHLVARKVSGATRKMLGKGRAVGGAATRNPAGSNTAFSEIGILASLEGESPHSLTFLSETEYTLYKAGVLAIAKTLTTKERSALPDDDFALIQDGERRFPIGDCAHARNALSRLPHAKNLSDSERSAIERKAKAKLATCGSAVAADKRLHAAAQAVSETIYTDLIQINQPSHIQLFSPVLAPHYYVPPFVMPTEVRRGGEAQARVADETALVTAKAELDAVKNALTERDAILAELQGKIQELEAKLQARKSSIGLTALALGNTGDKPKNPSVTTLRVVPK